MRTLILLFFFASFTPGSLLRAADSNADRSYDFGASLLTKLNEVGITRDQKTKALATLKSHQPAIIGLYQQLSQAVRAKNDPGAIARIHGDMAKRSRQIEKELRAIATREQLTRLDALERANG